MPLRADIWITLTREVNGLGEDRSTSAGREGMEDRDSVYRKERFMEGERTRIGRERGVQKKQTREKLANCITH